MPIIMKQCQNCGFHQPTSVEYLGQEFDWTCSKCNSNNKSTKHLNKQIENNFTYHQPKDNQPQKYQQIKDKAKELAYLINNLCPESEDRKVSLIRLQETVFWANASIARNE